MAKATTPGRRAAVLLLLGVPLALLAWWCAVRGISLYSHPEQLSDRARRLANRLLPFPD